MLRTITIDEVRLGMYIHAIEDSWWDHGFWLRRFLLTDQAKLDKLVQSGIRELTIDTAKGLVPQREQSAPAVAVAPHGSGAGSGAGSGDIMAPADDRPRTAAAERESAREIIDRSKAVMRTVFDGARLGQAVCSAAVIDVVEDISSSVARSSKALIGLVRLKSKDEYTYLHSVAVCALMVNLARHLGMAEAVVRDFGLAGLLHDIGKMSVPTTILNKPGPLSDDEFALVRTHSERGALMLRQGEAIPEVAIDVALHHHEKVDGTGYPFGLGAEQISIAARMGAICDVYDALTSDRIYKGAWSPIEAVTAMRGWRGQFDETLLFSFFQSLGIYPIGMLVRLNTGFLGIVLPNGRRASRPRIRLFYAVDGACIVEPMDITLSDHTANRVLREEDPTEWNVADWAGVRDHLLLELDQVEETKLRRLWHGQPKGQEIARSSMPSIRAWRPTASN